MACYRFVSKIALASFVYCFGEAAMDNNYVRVIRAAVVNEQAAQFPEDLIEVSVSREQNTMFRIEEIFPDCHTVWFSTTAAGTHAYISIFGVITARILIAPLPKIALRDKVLTLDYVKKSKTEHDGQTMCAIRDLPLSPEGFYCQLLPKSWFR